MTTFCDATVSTCRPTLRNTALKAR